MIPLSILDLVRVTQQTDARGALDNARDVAVHAEEWGYRRIWVAEHHNMAGIASAATSVVIAHIAAGTRTIRVGARSEEHTSELQSLMRISYAVFCLKKKKTNNNNQQSQQIPKYNKNHKSSHLT